MTSNDISDTEGTLPLPESDPSDDALLSQNVQHEALHSGPASDLPDSPMEPSGQPRRDQPPPLPHAPGLGTIVKGLGVNTPPLPALRQSAPLRTVLENLGPDLVAAQCGAINRFNRLADRAEAEDNKVIELLATKAAALYQHKLIELVVGRTVNVNASIKSQRDLPKLENLSPERRAQLHAIMDEMSGVVEGEYRETDE